MSTAATMSPGLVRSVAREGERQLVERLVPELDRIAVEKEHAFDPDHLLLLLAAHDLPDDEDARFASLVARLEEIARGKMTVDEVKEVLSIERRRKATVRPEPPEQPQTPATEESEPEAATESVAQAPSPVDAVEDALKRMAELIEAEKREAPDWAQRFRQAVADVPPGDKRKLVSDLDILLKSYKRVVKIRTDAIRTAIERMERGW